MEKEQGGKAGGVVRFEDPNWHSGDLAIFYLNGLTGAAQRGATLFQPPTGLFWSLFLHRRDAEGGLPLKMGDYLLVKRHDRTMPLSGVPWLSKHTLPAAARLSASGRSIHFFD